jgi:hypothetical protein
MYSLRMEWDDVPNYATSSLWGGKRFLPFYFLFLFETILLCLQVLFFLSCYLRHFFTWHDEISGTKEKKRFIERKWKIKDFLPFHLIGKFKDTVIWDRRCKIFFLKVYRPCSIDLSISYNNLKKKILQIHIKWHCSNILTAHEQLVSHSEI